MNGKAGEEAFTSLRPCFLKTKMVIIPGGDCHTQLHHGQNITGTINQK